MTAALCIEVFSSRNSLWKQQTIVYIQSVTKMQCLCLRSNNYPPVYSSLENICKALKKKWSSVACRFLFPCLSFISLSCVTRLYIKTGQLTVFSFNLEYYHCRRSNFHLFFSPFAVGGAQAWASVGQPTLADRKKWLTPTTTRMGPTHQLLALMRHHKGLQVPIVLRHQFLPYSGAAILIMYLWIYSWTRNSH